MKDDPLATPQRFTHKKSLGQNFLRSQVVPGWLCQAADLTAGEVVLEVGPGAGALTEALLAAKARVIAVEADERLLNTLKDKFAPALKSGQLTLHHGDALTLTPSRLGLADHSFKVVANIPYYLSGRLLREYLSGPIQPNTLVFLLQKELVERITRDPKSSLLSLSVAAFGTPRYVKTVGRGHFDPSPKVDSAILAVLSINRESFKDVSETLFFDLLHLGLGRRRKQLLGNLSAVYPRPILERVFTDLNLSLTCRGEDLDLATWLKLAKALTNP